LGKADVAAVLLALASEFTLTHYIIPSMFKGIF